MERTCELIKQAKEGNKEAQSILVEENSGLIWSVVKRFQGRGYDKEDLFQIGSIGLLKCIENFDLERNVKFSTYAVPLIMGEIKRFLRDDGIVKVSRSLKGTFFCGIPSHIKDCPKADLLQQNRPVDIRQHLSVFYVCQTGKAPETPMLQRCHRKHI